MLLLPNQKVQRAGGVNPGSENSGPFMDTLNKNNNVKVYQLILLTMYMYGSVYIRTCGVQFLDFDFIIYRESHNL